MRQHSWIALLGILAVLAGGCSQGEDTAVAPSPSIVPVPAPSAVPTASPIAPQTPVGKSTFPNPTVAQKPASVPGLSGLIPSTNSDVRLREIQKGRQDPFALVPLKPIVEVTPNETGSGSPPPPFPAPGVAPPQGLTPGRRVIPVPPPLPPVRPSRTAGGGGNAGSRGNAGGRTTIRPTTTPGARNGNGATAGRRNATSPGNRNGITPGSRIATAPRIPAPAPLLPKLPPLPEPNLARSVEVTGVVQVGGEPQAIVRVPNEPSRYVGVGQRLSNGQVLVKRIEVNNGASPVVILEQYGREVARRVGEKPVATPDQPGTPTAVAPAKEPGINGSPQA
ncbi:hypothetical protein NDI49_19935 [Trichocoleus sp. ST-U3]|uniref:hypothetical protein n=1 Tax=Coleofasciculus sp. FACHB-542 TaxID=2692787 RepID=UPI0016862EC5|nr:hypothetical protein [Coleofasciculus sp. FACHB-542]MBD2085478.1 hypothetical protein [Coleofasciculus sp. FACHB-542]